MHADAQHNLYNTPQSSPLDIQFPPSIDHEHKNGTEIVVSSSSPSPRLCDCTRFRPPVSDVLLLDVPRIAANRALRHGRGRPAEPEERRLPDPPLLPRLLRQCIPKIDWFSFGDELRSINYSVCVCLQGCDGSILLDSTAAFASEKFALPNNNSARGFELVDAIKARVEAICPATVSCADVLALSTQEGVALLGGPTWTVELGRRDSRAAFQTAANKEIPSPFDDLKELVALFRAKGLDARDMTALSGAHTIGQAQCFTYAPRIHEDRNIDGGFAARLRRTCPANGRGGARAPLDSRTPYRFDNAFYQELVAKRGLLHSDQELFNGGSQDKLVRRYSTDAAAFERDFAAAMVKMGALLPRPGTKGEIRRKCNRIN
ncbi:hypothetical protein ZIOFF_015237 [Zingiber officinale]|uniref:Peroxidase n=1 Tax=Zingiber officinale TaxID=94328 RepID=A0A8J5LF56_ZINOF|nr:hypothetical protein ZIOFF_015237 [Zingiber officinale]